MKFHCPPTIIRSLVSWQRPRCFFSSASASLFQKDRQVYLDFVSRQDHGFESIVSADGIVGTGDKPSIAIVCLNRPKANAMGHVLVQEFQECWTEIEARTATPQQNAPRCAVLVSSSVRVFSAGADLKERRDMTIEQARTFVQGLRHTFQRVAALPVPVVVAVDGAALGGGLELAMAADLRVASTTARLGLPETSWAIVPGAGGTQRLPQLVGLAKAKELIFTGAILNAHQALDCGLVSKVIGSDETADNPQDDSGDNQKLSCVPAALEMAWQIAQKGPVAIRAAKQALQESLCVSGAKNYEQTMEEALEVEGRAYDLVLETQDRLEGLAAFREKRDPYFKGE